MYCHFGAHREGVSSLWEQSLPGTLPSFSPNLSTLHFAHRHCASPASDFAPFHRSPWSLTVPARDQHPILHCIIDQRVFNSFVHRFAQPPHSLNGSRIGLILASLSWTIQYTPAWDHSDPIRKLSTPGLTHVCHLTDLCLHFASLITRCHGVHFGHLIHQEPSRLLPWHSALRPCQHPAACPVDFAL